MPGTPLKNLIYRMALPFLAPSPRGKMTHQTEGLPLNDLKGYEKLLIRHHVMGATLLLKNGDKVRTVHTSVPGHTAGPDAMYRVASITKMATALVALSMVEEGLFTLDTPVAELLPQGPGTDVLAGVTVRHLLCHTSGLVDTSEADKALLEGRTFHDVLVAGNQQFKQPGKEMNYCNFGFGLMGCIMEQATGKALPDIFGERLFTPLHMKATLDATRLDENTIMPITRVLPYRKGQDVRITRLGRQPLNTPDPLRHFGHTAGAMYANAPALSNLLTLIANKGEFEGKRILSRDAFYSMLALQSSTPTRMYGLGLVLLNRPKISKRMLHGHQGFAYGCVDGAFVEEFDGRQVIFLNGGASEARQGKLGLVNRDILAWALNKEMASWQ